MANTLEDILKAGGGYPTDTQPMSKYEGMQAAREMQLPLLKFLRQAESGLGEVGMMAIGPKKFEGLLGMIPKVVDKADNFQDLLKFDDLFMKLNSGEQKEVAKLALRRLEEGRDRADSILRSDVLNNPNASARLISNLERNRQHYNALGRKMEDILDGTFEPLNLRGGGIATLMPLRYGN